jgi:predicted enzyme related to lactoylglutathione lyase
VFFIVLRKVEAAGGKVTDEIQPESDYGLMQHFEDTEGNHLGMYKVKPEDK